MDITLILHSTSEQIEKPCVSEMDPSNEHVSESTICLTGEL